MDSNGRRFAKDFGIAIVAYTLLVPTSVWLAMNNQTSWWRFVFAVLPVVPSAFAMWAAIRFFRNLDELQRRIEMEGLAFAFVGTCLLTLTWGFLQNAGIPQADIVWVAPLLIVLRAVGLQIASRRYR
jgi:hypothetical protein